MGPIKSSAGRTIGVEEFKAVMRRFATSVSVITTSDGKSINGMTATAVCGVTAEPPTLLIIINRKNRSHPMIDGSKVFAVNILADDQHELANHFASRPDSPFDLVRHRIGHGGCPLISGADANLECVVSDQFESGTHTIFIGKIVGTTVRCAPPLLYHNGRYRRLDRDVAA
jgi:flavin reductase